MTDTFIANRNRDSVAESGNPTTDRMVAMAHGAIDRAAETANHAEHGVRGAATKTAEAARQAQDQVGVAAGESLRTIRAYVERNPLTCAGVAFAAGVLLSAVARR